MLSMDRELIVKKLIEFFKRLNDVKVAILFGSIARGSKYPHDIDIAVRFFQEEVPTRLS